MVTVDNDYYEVACEENQKKYKIPIDSINFRRNGLFYSRFDCKDDFLIYLMPQQLWDSIGLVPLHHVEEGLLDGERNVQLVHGFVDFFGFFAFSVEELESLAGGYLDQCQTQGENVCLGQQGLVYLHLEELWCHVPTVTLEQWQCVRKL